VRVITHIMVARQLPHQVLRFIEAYRLIETPGPLVVGVSGGADSMCLLHILHALRDRLGTTLHIAHLNHRLRGAESDADADYVFRMARNLGVPATIEERDVKAYQSEYRCSLEEAAREVRYAFLSEIAESAGARAVAVAHTADDQAETILLHLIRGTGLAGLRGMRPLSKWTLPDGTLITLIRPLLETRRAEIEAYCIANKLEPRLDSSNLSPEFLRNRVRAEIMPKLREYNPNIVESLCRTARIIADDIAYLDEEAARASSSAVEEFAHGLILDNKTLAALPPALGRHVLRSAFGKLVGNLKDIELVHIDAVMEALASPAGKKLSLPFGFTFYGDYEKSALTRGENPLALLPPLSGEHSLRIPGQTPLPGWRVTADVIGGKAQTPAGDGFTAYLDFGLTGADLTVRGRREGDRFCPLGMAEPKKLQDFMVDSKIPRPWRDRVPLVCAHDQIIWVVGWRIDHRFRVTDSTRRMLRLKFELEG